MSYYINNSFQHIHPKRSITEYVILSVQYLIFMNIEEIE